MRQPTVRSSVQEEYVRLREISGGMLCLASPSSPTQRTYRAVLEVSAINFTLKSEDEQEAIIAGYRALLKALTFPVQVVIRNQRLDLRSYIQRLFAENPAAAPGPSAWRELSASLADFVQKLASQRTLIERHFYIIIPASPAGVGAGHTLFLPLPFAGRKKRRQVTAETRERARQDLDVRSEMVMQQLAAIGLRSRRLGGQELAAFYHSCLTPERAIRHPLTGAYLAGVGRPKRVKVRKAGAPMQAVPSPYAKRGQGDPGGRLALSPPAHVQERQDGQPPVPLPDLLHLADLLAPASVEVTRDAICVENEYVRGIAITEFPREVSPGGWLAPLLVHDEVAELVWHFHPQDASAMLRQLKRRRAGYVSTRHFNQRQGRLDDPEMEVAEEDVTTLMGQVASGEERLFDLGFYVLVRACDKHTLDERTERMMAAFSMLLLDSAAHPTTFEHAQAFRSFLPEARDELMRTFTLDTTSLATAFPFISNSLYMPGGVLMGITGTGEPVMLNAWDESLENPHTFIGGVTGSGKSYLGKLLVERDLLMHAQQGLQSFVIDPDLEYQQLAAAMGGTVVRLAPGSLQRLNPFDLLPPRYDFHTYLAQASRGDRLAEKILDLHAMLDILLAEDASPAVPGSGMLTKREKGLLDCALYEAYRQEGITSDPRTHSRHPPLLCDVYDILKSGHYGPDETDLAGRLSRYVSGSLSSLFSDFTSVDLGSHLVVWDIREMRGELRPLAIALIADRVWTQALYDSRTSRSLYIDEAASLIEHPAGGQFLATLSRRARKRYLRLVTMTQNPEQFVQDPWGSVVAANAAIKVLKTQDATSAAAVAERFHLTRSEQQRLLTFGSHEALVLAGGKRVIISIPASPREHALITTNPVERAGEATGSGDNGRACGEADDASLDAHQLALSHQKTGPLVPVKEQPRDRTAALEATPLEGTNHHHPGKQHSELPAGLEG